MPKGIVKLSQTTKGKILVALDRLNGKTPMPLSYVSLSDMSYHDQECEFGFEKGLVTFIKIENIQIYPNVQRHESQKRKEQKSTSINQIDDSLLISETCLNKEIRELSIYDIDNFNLKFNKAARFNVEKEKFHFYRNDYRKNKEGIVSGDKYLIRPNYGHIKFEQIQKRLENQANIFSQKKRIALNPNWRLIVGIGASSVYEVGITLHHIYGIPYIPASSIKGMLRGWIIQSCFGVNKENEANAFNQSKLLCDVFGCKDSYSFEVRVDKNGIEILDDFVGFEEGKLANPIFKTKTKPSFYSKIKNIDVLFSEKKGDIIFFDSFPDTAPKLEVDIMNVHYPDYYNDKEGKIAPTDFQNPNPIPFLTVSDKNLQDSDLKFVTYIGTNETEKISEIDKNFDLVTHNTPLNGNSTLIEFVEYWLKDALANHGIGAKTAAGYGYFDEIKQD